MHTLYTLYMSMHSTLAKIKSDLLAFSNLDVYFIIHVYKITKSNKAKKK